MAVQFVDNIIENAVWSLSSPCYIRVEKTNSNTMDYIVTVEVNQGTYTKEFTYKYSGEITSIKFNLTELIKDYFQGLDLNKEVSALSASGVSEYSENKTMTVTLTIEDGEVPIETTQRFIKNSVGRNVLTEDFGEGNYLVGISESKEFAFNLLKTDAAPDKENDYFINFPLWQVIYDNFGSVISDRLEVTVKDSNNTTVLSQTFNPTLSEADVIRFLPINYYYLNGIGNFANGGVVELKYITTAAFQSKTLKYNIDYFTKCQDEKIVNVKYEGSYGGINSINFANSDKTYEENNKPFTLYGGRLIEIDSKYRLSGTLISEYIPDEMNDIFLSLFYSDVIYIDETNSALINDFREILITDKTWRKKIATPVELIQYRFNYREVERLTY